MTQMNPEEKQDLDRVEKAAQSLGEHFDTVQIFVTRHEQGAKDGTINIHLGAGNWFARYGQVVEWCVRQDEQGRIYMRKREDE